MSPTDTARREEPGAEARQPVELEGFGFDGPGDRWLQHVSRAQTPSPLGKLGGYELLAEVARGGQGIVYRAIQPGTGRLVAVKRLGSGSLATESMRRRFAREIEATAALDHPGIVKVFGCEVLDQQPALIMEWVEGITLARWARGAAGAPPDLERRLAMFLELCAAVEHAHQRGVLHRDLKSANVLVDARGQPRVLDFGIAKVLADRDRGGEITHSREFLGTPASAAPEQFLGRADQIDARTDVYALGGLLYEMLSGQAPFGPAPASAGGGSDVAALIDSVLHQPVASLGAVAPRLPRELDVIVRKALAKEPAQRYQSVAALAGDLQRFRAGAPLLAQPPTTAYLVRRLVARKPFAAAAVLAVLAAVLTFSVVVLIQTVELGKKRDRALVLRGHEAELRRRADAEQEHALGAEAESTRALALATSARASAETHAAQSRKVITFLEDQLFVNRGDADAERDGVALLESASQHVADVFADQPEVEGAVHSVLGKLYLGLGVSEWARWHQSCALVLRQATLGPEHPDVARTWRDLGSAWRNLGDDRRAEAAYRQALRSERASLGDSHPDTRGCMRSLASLLRARGDFDEAAAILEPLVAPEYTRRLGWDPDLAIDLSDLGWTEFLRGNRERGELLLRDGLARQEAAFGRDHLRVALPHERLARVALDGGDGAAAETSLRAALAIRARSRNANRPALADTMENLAAVLDARGASEEARDLRAGAGALRREEGTLAPAEDSP